MHRRAVLAALGGFICGGPAAAQPSDAGEEPPEEIMRAGRAGLLAPCAGPERDYEPVSLIALIADPQAHNGRAVQVIGYLVVGYHAIHLLLNQSAADYADISSGLEVQLNREDWGAVGRKLNNKQVLIRGVFNSTNRGGLDMVAGTIEQVALIDGLDSRRRPSRHAPPRFACAT